jgi:hypothetical protein
LKACNLLQTGICFLLCLLLCLIFHLEKKNWLLEDSRVKQVAERIYSGTGLGYIHPLHPLLLPHQCPALSNQELLMRINEMEGVR